MTTTIIKPRSDSHDIPAQIIRPDDSSIRLWDSTPNTPGRYDLLNDDPPNDASYIEGLATGDVEGVRFEQPKEQGSPRKVVVNIRGYKVGATVQVLVRLTDGDSGQIIPYTIPFSSLATAVLDADAPFEQEITFDIGTDGEWTWDELADLHIELENGGGAPFITNLYATVYASVRENWRILTDGSDATEVVPDLNILLDKFLLENKPISQVVTAFRMHIRASGTGTTTIIPFYERKNVRYDGTPIVVSSASPTDYSFEWTVRADGEPWTGANFHGMTAGYEAETDIAMAIQELHWEVDHEPRAAPGLVRIRSQGIE